MQSPLKLIQVASLFLLFFILPGYANTPPQYLMTEAKQQKTTPEQAVQLLKQGNLRFVEDKLIPYDYVSISQYASKGQFPFAIVLNCIDSRSSPDITFDQGLGNVFIARMAGNVVDKDVLGGMEYATKFAGAKVIAVVGHTYCGAVAGACKRVKAGNLTHLLASILPAVDQVKSKQKEKFSCKDPNTINQITKQNVINQLHTILKQSPIIKELVESKKVILIGGMHDLVSRKVTFFTIDGKDI